VFASTQSLDHKSSDAGTLPRYATSAELAALDADSVWCSASDVDIDVNVTVAASHRFDIMTE